MRIRVYIALAGFAVFASCGGTAKPRSEEVVEATPVVRECVVDRDSLLKVMEERYNRLCEERRIAFAERDAERRRVLIEASDSACSEFARELDRLLSECSEE